MEAPVTLYGSPVVEEQGNGRRPRAGYVAHVLHLVLGVHAADLPASPEPASCGESHAYVALRRVEYRRPLGHGLVHGPARHEQYAGKTSPGAGSAG